jgi:hypothetical protein
MSWAPEFHQNVDFTAPYPSSPRRYGLRADRHATAAFRATAAGLCASLQLRVIAHLLATHRTLLANFGAHGASTRVQCGAKRHKVGARSADFCTREQQLNVVRFGVFTARLQTVRDRLQTNAVAIKAFVDALLHFVCDLLCSLTRHIFFLPELLNLLYNKR